MKNNTLLSGFYAFYSTFLPFLFDKRINISYNIYITIKNGGSKTQKEKQMTEVREFCQAIMRKVVETGIITDSNQKKAVEIMRKETKDFFTGDKYKDQRECIQNGTIHDGYIIADIVTECVSQLSE